MPTPSVRILAARERARKWRAENIERAKQRDKDYNLANREKIQSQRKKHYSDNRKELVAKSVKWQKKFPEKHAVLALKSRLKLSYGLTIADREAILDKQGHRCPICKRSSDEHEFKWDIDHCHKTNRVRGILCHSCNVMLGFAHDDPERLRVAIAYLIDNP